MSTTESRLIIGWQVDENKAPQYWFKKGARPGDQADTDLVYAPAGSLGHHTAIIAQSGSGKSFFLGRLLEEIATKTKARCLVFDPNADFNRISDVVDAKLWTNAEYDPRTGRGRLPHEATRDDFERDWNKVSIRVLTAGKLPQNSSSHKSLKIPASRLSAEFLAEDLDSRHRSDVHLCQEVMRQLERLYRSMSSASVDLVEKFQILLEYAKNSRYGPTMFDKEFESRDLSELEKAIKSLSPSNVLATRSSFLTLSSWLTSSSYSLLPALLSPQSPRDFKDVATRGLDRLREELFDSLLRLANDVPSEVVQYYISKLEFLQSTGILHRGLGAENDATADIEIVDLPSLNVQDTRLLAVDYLLNSCWDRARLEWTIAVAQPVENDTRVPTFIVVDEAHNLIAREPRSLAERVVRERFRTIAAEGRKLGIFLIVVSQNPTKLDSFVLSECENRALMRLNSETVLEATKKDLGLDHLSPSTLQACLRFGLGRALIDGPWSPQGPTFLFAAARRTVEGGRNLRTEHWATAPSRPEPPAASNKKRNSEGPEGPREKPETQKAKARDKVAGTTEEDKEK